MELRATRTMLATVAALVIAASACMKEIANYDNESLSSLTTNPTPNGIATASQGMLRAIRNGVVGQGSYTSYLAFFGRDGYVLDPATPGLVPETLVGPLLHSTRNDWGANYQAIQLGEVILTALNTVAGLTDPQKEAVRGYVKTLQAYCYERVAMTHDQSGAVLQVGIDPVGTTAAPIATRDQVYAAVTTLYDQAATHLTAAGTTAFPFSFSPGFTGFTTPANFLKVNRGLKARVDVHRATLEPGAAATHYANALTALGLSFLSTSQPLTLGVYHSFSTASGDQSNTSFDPTGRSFHAHPSIETDAQLQADGVTKDARYLAKTFKKAPYTQSSVTSDLGLRIYSSNAGPVSILRNEDLILLRAEANLALGNRAAALADINLIRTTSGNLPAIADPGDPGLFNELVYNRRYSLFYEAHRWIDMRRWGLLAQLTRDLPAHRIFSRLPLPTSECTARSPQPSGCDNDPGI